MRAGAQRERLYSGIFIPKGADEQFARLENAFHLTLQSEGVSSKVRKAVKAGKLKKKPSAELFKDAVAGGVITQQEADVIGRAEHARNETIQVDDFGLKEYLGEAAGSTSGSGSAAHGSQLGSSHSGSAAGLSASASTPV